MQTFTSVVCLAFTVRTDSGYDQGSWNTSNCLDMPYQHHPLGREGSAILNSDLESSSKIVSLQKMVHFGITV